LYPVCFLPSFVWKEERATRTLSGREVQEESIQRARDNPSAASAVSKLTATAAAQG